MAYYTMLFKIAFESRSRRFLNNRKKGFISPEKGGGEGNG